MKLFKVTFSILVLFVVVAVAAIGALFLFADPNQLKPVIVKAVKTETGYDLSLNGKLSWSFYPSLGVNITNMALTAPDAAHPFVTLNNIRFAMNVSALLHGVNQLNGNLYIADAGLMKLHLCAVHATLHFDQGVLTISPLTASLYNGSLTGVVHGSQLTALPTWDWDMTVTNANIQNLLADVNGAEAKLTITGSGSLRFKGQTQGKTGDALYQNVKGSGVYSLQDGSVKAIDINYLLQTADALLNKQTITAPENMKETAFSRLSGSIRLEDGVLTSNDIELMAPAFITRGDLSLQLNDRDINAHLNIQSTKALKTQFSVPVLVAGSVMNPSVQLDIASINQMVAKKQLENVKVKVQEKVKALSGKANDFIKKLIGQ